jgi:hypothetical protein
MSHDGHLDAEKRRRGLAKQVLVALVIRVSNQRDTGRNQLGPGGLDKDLAIWTIEPDAVVGAGNCSLSSSSA